jgi:hypothetical protein
MLAKDCMESSKGAAGFRMKNEMASRGGFSLWHPQERRVTRLEAIGGGS